MYRSFSNNFHKTSPIFYILLLGTALSIIMSSMDLIIRGKNQTLDKIKSLMEKEKKMREREREEIRS